MLNNTPDEGAEGAQGVKAAVLTTEYDVFECASFAEDAGKWLRLMPDAGFVPRNDDGDNSWSSWGGSVVRG